VTMEYRERLGPEGFLDCLDCQDLVVAVVLRETEDLMETLDVLVWGWRVPWVPRVLMAHRAPQELGSLDLRVLEVLLENKVCEEWWAGRGLWGPRATASSARRSGCKPTRGDRRKDKQINDQMDFLALLNGLRFRSRTGQTEDFFISIAPITPLHITAEVVTLDNTQCLSLLIIFIFCCDTEYKNNL